MVGLHGVLIGLSYSLTGFVSYACSFSTNIAFQWRFPIAVQMLWPGILFGGMFFLPYSPRWLLSQGREEEAWETTKRLHVNKKDPEDSYARSEFRQMKEQITYEREHDAVGFLAQARLAFSRRSFRKRLALVRNSGYKVPFAWVAAQLGTTWSLFLYTTHPVSRPFY